jgi:glycosyltransferase involved in cell wall biosynthesis
MMPRLSIVAPSAYLLGGVQTWLDYLVPGLSERGWHVTVHLPHGRFSDATRYLAAHPLRSHSALVANPTGSREGRVVALARSIEEHSADMVLGVNIADLYEAVNRLRLQGRTVRLACALHGLQACFFRDLRTWSQALDGAVAVNRLGASAAHRLGGMPAERVFYAPCGIDVAPLPMLPNVENEPLRLVYAGRFDQGDKRVLDLARIASELQRDGIEFTLHLAGTGPDEAALREALAPFGMRVEFMGVLDERQLAEKLYRPGSVLLVTSPRETGPLAAWEAMARGVVVVSSAFTGLRAEGALQDGLTCLTFSVGCARDAALSVVRLRDVQLRTRLAVRAWQEVAKRYSRAMSIEAWDAALRRIGELTPLPAGTSPEPTVAHGRLDRLLGRRWGEAVRRRLHLRFEHTSAGGEWPHSYAAANDPEIDAAIAALELSQ